MRLLSLLQISKIYGSHFSLAFLGLPDGIFVSVPSLTCYFTVFGLHVLLFSLRRL